MAICEITGKHTKIGNNVSHANNRTKRTFKANLQKVKIVDEDGTVRRAYVQAKTLRKNAVKKAAPRKALLEQLAADGKISMKKDPATGKVTIEAATPAKKAAKKK